LKLQHQQYCRFGSGLDRLRLSLSGSFNFTFHLIISTGQTSDKFPALRQCRPLYSSSANQLLSSHEPAGHILECFPPNFKRKAGLFKSNKICELEFGFPRKYIFNFSDLLSENYVSELGEAMTSFYLRVP